MTDIDPLIIQSYFGSVKAEVAREYLGTEKDEIWATETYEDLVQWLLDYHHNDADASLVIIEAFIKFIGKVI